MSNLYIDLGLSMGIVDDSEYPNIVGRQVKWYNKKDERPRVKQLCDYFRKIIRDNRSIDNIYYEDINFIVEDRNRAAIVLSTFKTALIIAAWDEGVKLTPIGVNTIKKALEMKGVKKIRLNKSVVNMVLKSKYGLELDPKKTDVADAFLMFFYVQKNIENVSIPSDLTYLVK